MSWSLKRGWLGDAVHCHSQSWPMRQSFLDLSRVEGSIFKMSHPGDSWQKASISYHVDFMGTLRCVHIITALPQREGKQASAVSFKNWPQKSQPSCLWCFEKQVTKSSPYSKGTKLSPTSVGQDFKEFMNIF